MKMVTVGIRVGGTAGRLAADGMGDPAARTVEPKEKWRIGATSPLETELEP
jgi:hypothetical protein